MGKKRDILDCVIFEMDENRKSFESFNDLFQPGFDKTCSPEVAEKQLKKFMNLKFAGGWDNRLIEDSTDREGMKTVRNVEEYTSLEKKNKKNLDRENKVVMLLDLEQCFDGGLPSSSDYANTALKSTFERREEDNENTCLKQLNSEVIGHESEEIGIEKGILDIEKEKNEKESLEDVKNDSIVNDDASDIKENVESLLEKFEWESSKEEVDEGNSEEEGHVVRKNFGTEVENVSENIVREVLTCGTVNVCGSVVERDNLCETGGETDGETGNETRVENGNMTAVSDDMGVVCESQEIERMKGNTKINNVNEVVESLSGTAEIDENGKQENKGKESKHSPRNGGNRDDSGFQSKFLFNEELEISSTESGFCSMNGSDEDVPSIVNGSFDRDVCVLTHPEPNDGPVELHRLAPSSQLMIPGNGLLEFDSTTKWNNVQNKSVSNENLGRQHGDDKHRSGGGYSGGRKSDKQPYGRSGRGFGMSLNQFQLGCGGGCGDGRDDDEDDSRRERFFTEPNLRNGSEKIKLKKKCRLEHGVLTLDEVSILLGELHGQTNKLLNGSPQLNEVLKCMTMCQKSDDDGVDCDICNNVTSLVRHFHSCSRIDCSICLPTVGLTRAFKHRAEEHGEVCNCERDDLISLKEFAKSAFPMTSSSLVSDDEGSDSNFNMSIEVQDSSGAEDSSAEDEKVVMFRRNDSIKLPPNVDHKKQEVDWNRLFEELCDQDVFPIPNILENVHSNPGADASLSPPVSLPPKAPSVSIPPEVPSVSRPTLQGPPAERYPSENQFDFENRYFSEYFDEPGYRGMQRNNRSLPADTKRGGCVVYGSKFQLRMKAKSLKETRMLKSTLTDGIILDDRRPNMMICNGSYEPEEEWEYTTEEALGHGTSGRCFPCIDIQTRFQFCAKKIHVDKFEIDEVMIWSKLEHHDVVELYGIVLFGDHIYILQELILGPTLLEYIGNCQVLNFYSALIFFQNLLEILKYFNSKKIIHNDIKADNIMIRGESQRIVIIDFGLAQQCDRVQPNEQPVGGQVHLSPEKAASEGYGHGADVWAATVILVHMLAGIEPWIKRFHGKQLFYIIKKNSPPMEDVPEDIPELIRELIRSGWTVDPNMRPSAEQLLKHRAFQLVGDCLSDEIFNSHAIERAGEVESVEALISLNNFNSFHECNFEETEQLISMAEEFLSQERAASISLSSSQIPRVLSFREPADRFSSLRYHSQLSAVPESQLELQQEVRENKRGAFLEDEEDEEKGEREGRDLSAKYDDLLIGGHIYGPEVGRGREETNSLETILSCVEEFQKKRDDVRNSNLGNFNNLGSIIGSTGPYIPWVVEESTGPSIPRTVVESTLESTFPDIPLVVEEMISLDIPRMVKEMFRPNIPLVVEQMSWLDSFEGSDQSPVEPIQLGEDEQLDNVNPEEDENANVPSRGDTSTMTLQSTVEERLTAAPRRSLLSLGWPSSIGATMGTTVIVMLDGKQVYALHLHPGCAPYWSEVALRASTEVHRHDVAAFTLEQQLNEDGDMEQVDINGEVPANARITVHVRRVTDVQNWDWKLDGGKVIYNPASFCRQR